MATHSGVLAWRIPGTGDLVGCRVWGRTESDTTEVYKGAVLSWLAVILLCYCLISLVWPSFRALEDSPLSSL